MREIDILAAAKQHLEFFETRDITIAQSANMITSSRRIEALRDYPTSKPLSARHADFTETNSFWLFLEKDGRDVGGLCGSFNDLGSEPIEQFWERSYNRLFFPDGDGRVTTESPEGVVQIGRRSVYFGDLYLIEDIRGSSEQLTHIMRLAFIVALLKWPDLDTIYSFVRTPDATRAPTYGFTDIIPSVVSWSESRNGRSNDEYILSISAARLSYTLGRGV